MRVFAFALLLVGCSGATEQAGAPLERSEAGASSSAGALGAAVGGSGSGGASGSAGTATVGSAGMSGGESDQGGVAGVSAGAGGMPSVAGAGGMSPAFGGASGAMAASGSGGATQGGAGGSGDPLAPFPAPGCEDWTAYRVPPGKYLAIWGSFQTTSLKNGACQVLVGTPYYETCGAAGNVSQCVCTVTSPPTCGQYCDGADIVTVLKAEPGKAFHTELRDGDGQCVAGVPVAK